MSLSTIVVAANAQLLRGFDLSVGPPPEPLELGADPQGNGRRLHRAPDDADELRRQ
jgi:hypothetical protein